MKVLFYIFYTAFLFLAGGFLLHQSVEPPYVSNTLQLLQFQSDENIQIPLPWKSWAVFFVEVPATQEGQLALLGLGLLGFGAVLVYFFPSFVGRNRREGLSIFLLNLFVGWSFLGWVIALIWAVTKDPIFLVEPPSLSLRLKELSDLSKEGLLEAQEFKKLKAQMLENFVANAPEKTWRKVKRKCPHCAYQYRLSVQLIGKKAQCKKCRKQFTI